MNSEQLFSYIEGMSDQVLIALALALVLIIGGVIAAVVSKQRFYSMIRRASDAEELSSAILERFRRHRKAKTARLLLEHIPDAALFTVFISALENTKIAEELLKWIDSTDDMFVYRRLALSGKGEPFDGRKAREFFSDRLERIREMTGDPEWPARYLAVKVLLYESENKGYLEDFWRFIGNSRKIGVPVVDEVFDRLGELRGSAHLDFLGLVE